jgi:hypothetical protein
MTWAKLLANKTVTALAPTKAELDNLRSIVTRSLKDMTAAACPQMRGLLWRTTRRAHFR